MSVCKHISRTAKVAWKNAVVRSMTSPETNHERGNAYMLTGYRKLQTLEGSSMRSVKANELGSPNGMPP